MNCNSNGITSRLARALRLYLNYARPARARELLARHPDLTEYLAPMLGEEADYCAHTVDNRLDQEDLDRT